MKVTVCGTLSQSQAMPPGTLCAKLPVVNGQTAGVEFADMNAQLAVEFLRQLIRP